MGNHIHLQRVCNGAAASVGLAPMYSLCSYCRGSIIFLKVLNISGLSIFPSIEGMPVTLAQLLPLVK